MSYAALRAAGAGWESYAALRAAGATALLRNAWGYAPLPRRWGYGATGWRLEKGIVKSE